MKSVAVVAKLSDKMAEAGKGRGGPLPGASSTTSDLAEKAKAKAAVGARARTTFPLPKARVFREGGLQTNNEGEGAPQKILCW